jgi:hypothetical protein
MANTTINVKEVLGADCPARTSSTASSRAPTATRPSSTTGSASSTRAASGAPATSRSCRSTRASSTPPARRSPPTPTTSTREDRRARHRGRLQRRRLHLRRARHDRGRKYAHKIPFIVKFNHNEMLTYPNTFDQIPFGTVRQAWNMGAAAVGATIYFGSRRSREQIQYVAEMFAEAHELGMVTVLWCYLRNNAFKVDGGRLPHRRRPHRPGQPPRRHHPGRHHQAEAPDQQRRVRGAEHRRLVLRQVRQADLHRARRQRRERHGRSPHRPAATRSPTATWAASP